MLIVAGKLYVHPQERDRWVAAHHEITRIARSQPGCLDLHLPAGPLEEGRGGLFEQWESEAALRAWRAAADPPKPQILDAEHPQASHQLIRAAVLTGRRKVSLPGASRARKMT